MNLPTNPSESTKRRNPELYPSLGQVAVPKRKPDQGATLVKNLQAKRRRQKRLGVCVTLVACRHRQADTDNNIAGLKPIRDSIARSLGVDDADPRIEWCYSQAVARGEEGVIVNIKTYPH